MFSGCLQNGNGVTGPFRSAGLISRHRIIGQDQMRCLLLSYWLDSHVIRTIIIVSIIIIVIACFFHLCTCLTSDKITVFVFLFCLSSCSASPLCDDLFVLLKNGGMRFAGDIFSGLRSLHETKHEKSSKNSCEKSGAKFGTKFGTKILSSKFGELSVCSFSRPNVILGHLTTLKIRVGHSAVSTAFCAEGTSTFNQEARKPWSAILVNWEGFAEKGMSRGVSESQSEKRLFLHRRPCRP